MDSDIFDELLDMVTPLIMKLNTNKRDAIPVSQRLSVTLRYLITGMCFEQLKFDFAISPQSIGQIIIDTCKALIKCLKGYIKVNKNKVFV